MNLNLSPTTRRWSLIGLIAVLAVALGLVAAGTLIQPGRGGDEAGVRQQKQAQGKGGTGTKATAGGSVALREVGRWPADEREGAVLKDTAGKRDATAKGTFGRTQSPVGGALQLDGATGFADTGAPILDTVNKDYSVAAWVRLDGKGFRTAVSLDGAQGSVFYLQYSDAQKRFMFSFTNARAVARKVGDPEIGRWYHLVGTYSHMSGTLKIHVDGKLAGKAQAQNPERPVGNLVIGRAKFQNKEVDFWSGGIADVRAFDRALNPQEVAQLAAQRPGKA
ncbi:LamG domain-containing protein [Streptomyces sp. NPDC048603]|uniref:LamG domain-containing protein n=1 Tax=Streptomyces sp. NPDC048603 TaxID=3365577 RepID=UPI00371E1DD0